SSLATHFLTATCSTEIPTLSLHDALPIFWNALVLARWRQNGAHRRLDLRCVVRTCRHRRAHRAHPLASGGGRRGRRPDLAGVDRSEEHTSELQSREKLVCRLLLEKKKCTH